MIPHGFISRCEMDSHPCSRVTGFFPKSPFAGGFHVKRLLLKGSRGHGDNFSNIHRFQDKIAICLWFTLMLLLWRLQEKWRHTIAGIQLKIRLRATWPFQAIRRFLQIACPEFWGETSGEVPRSLGTHQMAVFLWLKLHTTCTINKIHTHT